MARGSSGDEISDLAFALRATLESSQLTKVDDDLRGRGRVSVHLHLDTTDSSATAWWLDRVDREARRSARLFELSDERAFRPVRPAVGGLRLRRINTGSVEAVLDAYGAVESFFSSHPILGAGALAALVRGGRGSFRVFKRFRGRNAESVAENPVEDDPLAETDAQAVASVSVDLATDRSNELLLPGRDFEVLNLGRLAVRHRDGGVDTILR